MAIKQATHAQRTHRTAHAKQTHQAKSQKPAAFGKADVNKMTDYLDNNGFDDLGGRDVKFSQLKGDAKTDFKEFQKNMGTDYPSTATLTKLENKNVLVVHESNDGGEYFGIYNPSNGKRLASGSAGESDSPNWSVDVK
jgi:hypothetical protein